MGIWACPGTGVEGQSWNFPGMRQGEQGKGFPGVRAGSKENSRAHSQLAGGQLQEPPRQPRGFPGKHQTAPDHGSVPLEHPSDRPLGPGRCQDISLFLLEFLLHPRWNSFSIPARILLHSHWNSSSILAQIPTPSLLEFLLQPPQDPYSSPTRIPAPYPLEFLPQPHQDPCSIPAGIPAPSLPGSCSALPWEHG